MIKLHETLPMTQVIQCAEDPEHRIVILRSWGSFQAVCSDCTDRDDCAAALDSLELDYLLERYGRRAAKR